MLRPVLQQLVQKKNVKLGQMKEALLTHIEAMGARL